MKTWRAKVTIRNSISFYLSIHTALFSSLLSVCCYFTRFSSVLFGFERTLCSFGFERTSITTKYEKFGVPNYDDDGDDDDEGRCFLFDTSTMCRESVFVCVFSFGFSSI